jgi:hypothetical protein
MIEALSNFFSAMATALLGKNINIKIYAKTAKKLNLHG